jgi:hypothetical protein
MATIKPRVEPPVPDSYLRGIGRVITQWAYFEVEFDGFLNFFLMVHPAVKALTSRVPRPFNKRVRLFRDAVAVAFPGNPAIASRLDNIATKASALRHRRDHVVHGRWFSEGERKLLGLHLVTEGDWGRVETARYKRKTSRHSPAKSANFLANFSRSFRHLAIGP